MQAQSLYDLGCAALARGEYSRADDELGAALQLAIEEGDALLRVHVLRALLKSAFFNRNPDKALLRGTDALEAARASGDSGLEALTHSDLGLVYGNLSDFEGALEHLLEALRLHRATGTSKVGTVLNNIGNVYLELEDHAEALTFFRTAAEALRIEADGWRNEAIAIGNVGRSHLGLGQYKEALQWLERSVAIYEQNGDTVYLSPALARYGTALAAMRREEEATAAFQRSHDLLESASRGEFADEVLSAYGKFELSRNRPNVAIELLHRALATIPSGESTGRVFDLHHSLARGYEAVDDTRAALLHYKAYHRVKDAVASTTITVRIRRLMMQFDVERARQQEELFRARTVELASANAKLHELHNELQRKNRELHEISIKDPLTNLFNRRYLDVQLDVEISRALRHQRPLCAAMCDIDHFKMVNDYYSHGVGDQVLRTISGLIRESARLTDIISRYGGEEFVLILPDTDLAGAEALTERLRQRVSDYPWKEIAPGLRITLSIGLALLDDSMSSRVLLDVADQRLYDAKRSGRDRVVA